MKKWLIKHTQKHGKKHWIFQQIYGKSIKNNETHLKTFTKQWQMVEINMSNQWKRMKQLKTALQKNMKNIENTLKESVKNNEKHWKNHGN